MGLLPVLGALAVGATKKAIGNAIDRRSNRSAEHAQFQDAMDRGLTPWEYYGAGQGSQGVGATDDVMGNMYESQQLQQNAQAYDAQQKQLDREVMLNGQATQLQAAQTSAQATLGAAAAAANASKYGADIQLQMEGMRNQLGNQRLALDSERLSAELPTLLNQNITTAPEFVRRTQQMTMSAQNVIAQMMTDYLGVDMNDPDAVKSISKAQFQQFLTYMRGIDSAAFREFSGAALSGANTLGNTFGVGGVGVPNPINTNPPLFGPGPSGTK